MAIIPDAGAWIFNLGRQGIPGSLESRGIKGKAISRAGGSIVRGRSDRGDQSLPWSEYEHASMVDHERGTFRAARPVTQCVDWPELRWIFDCRRDQQAQVLGSPKTALRGSTAFGRFGVSVRLTRPNRISPQELDKHPQLRHGPDGWVLMK